VVDGEATVGLRPHVDLQLTDALIQLALQRRERRLIAVVRPPNLHIVDADEAVTWECDGRPAAAGRREHQRHQRR
jgi:hypothetical protein